MKRVVVCLLFLATLAAAFDSNKVESFVVSSVVPENANLLGFQSTDELRRLSFGAPLSLGEVDNALLMSYPQTSFALESKQQLIPLLIDGIVRSFVLIDDSGEPLALGFRELAEGLSEVSQLFNLPIEEIELYSSTQINNYLISIPLRYVAKALGHPVVDSDKNLFVFGYNKRGKAHPTPPDNSLQLPSEKETIAWLKGMGE